MGLFKRNIYVQVECKELAFKPTEWQVWYITPERWKRWNNIWVENGEIFGNDVGKISVPNLIYAVCYVWLRHKKKKIRKSERVNRRKKTTTQTGFHINIMRGLCTFLVGLRGTSAEPLHCLFIRFGRREITIRPFADLPIKHSENANRKPSVVLSPFTPVKLYIYTTMAAQYTTCFIIWSTIDRILLRADSEQNTFQTL